MIVIAANVLILLSAHGLQKLHGMYEQFKAHKAEKDAIKMEKIN